MNTPPLSNQSAIIISLVGWGSALVLLLAGCAPVYPMDSAGLQDAALRARATETAAPVRTAESAHLTEQAYAEETRQSGQATSAASTAAIGRATEIAVESTAQQVRNDALQAQAEYRVTDAWLNAQLTSIPEYRAATVTRHAQVAIRQAKIKDTFWIFLAWCGLVIVVILSLLSLRRQVAEAEELVDALTIARDEARRLKQEQAKYDVSKQEANNGANGNDACNQYRADAVHGSQMATEWRPNGNVVQPAQTSDAAPLSDDGIPAAGV